MENLGKKVGFLNGLIEGMSFDTDSANGKLMAGIVGLLGDLSDRVEAIDELLEDLNDYVESIEEDLTELEGGRDDINGLFDDEDDDEDFDEMMFDNSEDKLHLLRPARGETPEDAPGDAPGADSGEAPEEDSVAGNLCPECHATFYTALNDPADAQYVCPNCNKKVRPVRMRPEDAVIVKPVEE
jgi:DNA-directed RNA polymerase subunit RPC12/RpoP